MKYTVGVAIQIALQYDIFAETPGMPLKDSLELVKESSKVLKYQDEIDKIRGLAKKKFESITGTDEEKEKELSSINKELNDELNAFFEKECEITFEPINSEKITSEMLDKNIDKETGASKCRRALIILSKQGLIK